MINAKLFLSKMIDAGFYPFLCVPCSNFKVLIECILAYYPDYYYPLNNEGETVALAVGLFLNGKKPVLLIQNSGIGNMLDPITSLLEVYEIPLVFLTSWRGRPESNDEKQHLKIGEITKSLYSLLNIECLDFVFSKESDMEKAIKTIIKKNKQNQSVNILIDKGSFQYEKVNYPVKDFNKKLTTHTALDGILNILEGTEKIISSTGYLSRELYYLKHSENNFYMVGSMGCAIDIGLGYAIDSKEMVVVLDGDGAVLMRLEGMVSAGYYHCPNLLHIIFKNNMYESTGGQENLAIGINFDKIAKACRYNSAVICNDMEELTKEVVASRKKDGPYLIVVEVGNNDDIVGRPHINYTAIRDFFRKKD